MNTITLHTMLGTVIIDSNSLAAGSAVGAIIFVGLLTWALRRSREHRETMRRCRNR